MNQQIRDALTDLGLALVKGVKVTLVYILPAVIIGVITSPAFRDYLLAKPEIAAYGALINVILVVLGSVLKANLPDDSTIKKMI